MSLEQTIDTYWAASGTKIPHIHGRRPVFYFAPTGALARGDWESHVTSPPDKLDALHGWKEIAAYTGFGARTLQSYEHDLGLPVRRIQGKGSWSVVANPEELDNWLKTSLRPQSPAAKTENLRERTPLPIPDCQSLELRKRSVNQVSRLVNSMVVRRGLNFYIAHRGELEFYRSNTDGEKSRNLPVVICRICGQILTIITAAHLGKPDHDTTIEVYKDQWYGAPLVSTAYRAVSSIAAHHGSAQLSEFTDGEKTIS